MRTLNTTLFILILTFSTSISATIVTNFDGDTDEKRAFLGQFYLSYQKPQHQFSAATTLWDYSNDQNFHYKGTLDKINQEDMSKLQSGYWIYTPSFLTKNNKTIGALIICDFFSKQFAQQIINDIVHSKIGDVVWEKTPQEIIEEEFEFIVLD